MDVSYTYWPDGWRIEASRADGAWSTYGPFDTLAIARNDIHRRIQHLYEKE